ncbi:Long chronological lifespan protein 2 [Cercospora beticola]|uniref:Long chronological lifespan protein 2 n=2 Tax=Cercospora TaxID=29002 RepID=A0A2G5HHM8_CERBT|nr:Long chronological lifespan protein 2 [Cercospora beticola]XP_044661578.1 uncharacterized protein CKM354_001019200 [Cercospora kikuchii]PIA92005.1 Long chronological lifespan protein 2 [Cercospora beticola]WPB06644.1 Long chronological lifespan protein 2 [Cercospora beticola]CAK1366560.1 unnamed protein product [Cercospora beticola]GIZ47091.1 hypothetical protein CKM354_001019200 [Cercospora kikuchii]
MHFQSILGALLLLVAPGMSQFFNFGNMFGQQQQHQEPQNMGSDSDWYQQNYEGARCDKYLCPHTLSCVHFPHHCPCAFPKTEDKIEFGEGSMACVSKGGFKEGESLRKIELARKGLL